MARKPATSTGLKLEANAIVESDPDLKFIINRVHSTMKSAYKLSNDALLRYITDCKPVLLIETQWSAKRGTLDRFVLLHEDLRKVNTIRDTSIWILQHSFMMRWRGMLFL